MAKDIWHRFFCDGIKLWCHDETDIHESVTAKRTSDVYHLLPMCHAHIEVRINFSASESQLSHIFFFFKVPWISQQTQRVSTLWLCCISQLIRRTLKTHKDTSRLNNNPLSGHKNIGFARNITVTEHGKRTIMSETRLLWDNFCVFCSWEGGGWCIEVMKYRLDQYDILNDNFFRTHVLLIVSLVF